MKLKTCTKCLCEKPLSEFGKDVSKRDGLRPDCRKCISARQIAWRAANPEKQKLNERNRYLANSEARKKNSNDWYTANADKAKARMVKYRAANTEKIRVTIAKWRLANPEKAKHASKKWNAANPEYVRINAQNRRARKREAGGKLSKWLSDKLFKLQRGKCACGCKQSLGADYHLDHRMPLALGGSNEDDNIQLLRAKCNLQKSAKHPVDFMQQRGFLL